MSDKTTTFSVSVPEKLKQKTENRISSGDFSGLSDYVRRLIRNDLEKQQKLENLRAFVQESNILTSGRTHFDVLVLEQD